jgi:long-chain acyl-CoA synthetase
MDQKPWLKYYGKIPHSIDYPEISLYKALMRTVERCPDSVACDFLGYTSTYRRLADEIDRCANAPSALGLKNTVN